MPPVQCIWAASTVSYNGWLWGCPAVRWLLLGRTLKLPACHSLAGFQQYARNYRRKTSSSPENCEKSCHSCCCCWVQAQTFVSNCPSGFASGSSPSPRRHEMEPPLGRLRLKTFHVERWPVPAAVPPPAKKLAGHKMHNQSWPLALLKQMKIVLMRSHGSYLYFNLLEGKVSALFLSLAPSLSPHAACCHLA